LCRQLRHNYEIVEFFGEPHHQANVLNIEVIAKPTNLPGTQAADTHFSATATLACDVSRGFAISSFDKKDEKNLTDFDFFSSILK